MPLVEHLQLRANPSLANLNSPIPQSSLADAWHNYPRFGLTRTTASSTAYVVGAALAAAPWLILAVACLLAALCACGAPRRRARASTRIGVVRSASHSTLSSLKAGSSKGEKTRAAAGVALGVFFFNASFALVGVGLVATHSFFAGAQDTFSALSYGVDGTFGDALTLAKFFDVLLDSLENLGPVGTFLDILSDVDNLRSQAATFVVEAADVRSLAQSALRSARIGGIVVHAVLLVLFAALLGGLLLLFVAASRRRKARSTSCVMCAMLFPLVLSWAAVAVVAIAGVAAGDACVMLGDYHKLVLDQAVGSVNFAKDVDGESNLLWSSGLTCPAEYVPPDVLESLRSFISDAALTGSGDAAVADSLFFLLFPGQDASGVSTYATNIINGLAECTAIVRFAGRLHHATCSSTGPVAALFFVWITLVLLAVILTASYFTAAYSEYDPTAFHTPLNPPSALSPSSSLSRSFSDPGSDDAMVARDVEADVADHHGKWDAAAAQTPPRSYGGHAHSPPRQHAGAGDQNAPAAAQAAVPTPLVPVSVAGGGYDVVNFPS